MRSVPGQNQKPHMSYMRYKALQAQPRLAPITKADVGRIPGRPGPSRSEGLAMAADQALQRSGLADYARRGRRSPVLDAMGKVARAELAMAGFMPQRPIRHLPGSYLEPLPRPPRRPATYGGRH